MSIRAFSEAAETSPRRVRRLIRQGRLRTLENQAGEVRIPESELDRVLQWKECRALRQSMEMQAVGGTALTSFEGGLSAAGERAPSFVSAEVGAMQVPLLRHEAAMMRLGFLESELATTNRLLKDTSEREGDLKVRAEQAEHDAISATVRAVEAESAAEEMRTQVIESGFKAVELEQEVRRLQEQLQSPWWKRILEGVKKS